MKVLLKSLKLWNIVEDGYEEPDDEDRLTQQQKNALSDKREKDSKALFQIYQTIERPVFERIAKAETSKITCEMIQIAYKGGKRYTCKLWE